jgi:heptosyltransferase II
MLIMKNLLELRPKNIVVKMPNWLGDAVMAIPVLKDLKTKFPDAKITAFCQANIAPLFLHDPYLTETISYKKPSGWIPKSWIQRINHSGVIEPLQHGNYDLGILMTNSFSSAWWFWRGGVENRIGFAGAHRSFLLTAPVDFPENIEKQHLIQTYKKLLEPLGISPSSTMPELFLGEEDLQYARDFKARSSIGEDDLIVGINPGAAYGTAKCWLPERFREVAEKLLKLPNVFILFFGDQTGAPLVHTITQGMPARVINMAGKTTLRELMALIGSCKAFLTNDSGPMHIASALNIPNLALFGSTNPTKTGPYLKGKVLYKGEDLKCSPCYKRVCPIDFPCMTRITSQDVFEQLKKML